MTLFQCDAGSNVGGTQIATTTTIAGAYEFGPESPNMNADVCLDPAETYYVVFDIANGAGEALEDYNFSSNSETCGNADESDDIDPSNGTSTCYNPSDDDDDTDINAGIYPSMSIGSTVFYDQNNDGVQDITDPLEGGIEGVQVDLYFDANNDGVIDGAELTPIASVSTDSDGNYYFGDLMPGNYQVGVPTPDESALTSSAGQNTTDNEDLSDDGAQAAAGGATLSPIINLEGGQELTEDGANPGADQDDADDPNGNMTVDFGFVPQMSIGSTVFNDPNDNGIQDTSNPLEDGIEGVTVNLYFDADGDGVLTGDELTAVETTVTDADGNYLFDNLPEGDYIVGVTPSGGAPVSSTGQMDADGSDGNDNGDQPGGSGTEVLSNVVNLDGNMENHTEDEQGGDQDTVDDLNGDMTVDFGMVPNMSIGSTVFLDNDDDGMQDPTDSTESGIEGVTVQLLYDADGDGVISGAELTPVATTMTDADGNYFFGMLPEGNYQVVIPTAPESAPTSSTPTDTMDNGEDGDDNGVQPGGAGTAVSSPIINLTATVEPQDGGTETDQGTDQDGTAAADANGDMTIDFGFLPYVSVGSNVFVDEDNDGVDDGDDEEGIEGVTVEVYSTGPDMMIGGGDDVLVGMDITDMNGDWLVDSLIPGEYYAVINTVDPNYPTSSTTDFAADDSADDNDNGTQAGGSGTAVTSNEFTLTGSGESTTETGSGADQDDADDDNGDMTVDFGFVPYYSLGNQVWVDDNYDGLINGSESGIEGVDVELYDDMGNLVAMTMTDMDGLYLFDSLLPGDYIVVIPATELAVGGTLQDYLSSTGTFNMGGPFEDPGVDAETNTDGDDNGTFNTNVDYPQAVVSSVVTLGGDDEPLGEDPDNDPNTLDIYENLTIDFGFIEKVYDVALIKETDMETGNKVGDTLTFTITVSNQGNTPLTNIEVTDYISSGFVDVPTLNGAVTDASGSGWSTPPVDDKIKYVVGDTLAPNESTTVTVYLELVQTLEAGGYVNYGEVSMFQDTIGNSTDGTGPYVGGIEDEDSTPDDTNSDPGGQPNSDADDYVDGDGTGVIGDGVDTTDEDDHDPALIQVVDIALAKTTLTNGPYAYGQEIEYNIEVINQGNVDLEDVLVSDYIPCGLTFGPSNVGWMESGGVATTTIDALAAGESANVSVFMVVIPVSGTCEYDGAYVNVAEVSQMFADYDRDGDFSDDVSEDDIDSRSDSTQDNDAGGQANSDADNEVDGNGTGTEGDGVGGTDEDDSDPEFIEIFDLAQIKFIDNEGPYDIGETATFEFEITNQGNVDAFNIDVTDYLSEGFSFSTTGNDGWSPQGDNLVYTIEGPLAPGETETIFLDLMVVLPDNASVQSWYNESEISSADDDTDPDNEAPMDADSTPDTNPDNDNDLIDGSDEDPIFNLDDENDNVIDENPNDPFGLGDDDEDDNDAAGILVVGGLGDTVWKDLNGDGIQDTDEPGVQGVVVILSDCDGNFIDLEVTDSDGFYFFDNLIPGDYQVNFDISGLEEGCTFTFQDQGGDDELDSDVDLFGFAPCTTIQGGEYDSTFDAGLLILSSLGDFVWHDLDGDGVQDGGEPGIEGVVVNLYDEDGNSIASTVTDENGYYLFDNLYPDTYFVEFIDPEGFFSTEPNQGANGELDSDVTNEINIENGGSTTGLIILGSGDENLSIDAGYYMCVPIGETVWYDINTNDQEDSNENGLNGMRVVLWKLNNGVWQEYDFMFTGHKPGTPSDDGYYKFCAPPGTYYVEVVLPPQGLVPAQANIGSDLTDNDITNANGFGTTNSFTVLSGEEKCDIGAGYYPMAEVGNFVWHDQDQNGIQNAGEEPLENVIVQVFDESNSMISETVTDEQGKYNIDYLGQTQYYFKFTPPNGYGATTANATVDEYDSDVTHAYGSNTTNLYSLQSGEAIKHVDAGMALGVLPVEWLHVRANNRADHNLVEWATATEINSDYFEVERKIGENSIFSTLGKVEGAGMSTEASDYKYEDGNINQVGIYYYRIKQVDTDGRVNYSDIVSVSIDKVEDRMSLYPNPAIATTLIKVSGVATQDTRISIFSKEGKLIRSNLRLEEVSTGQYELILDVSTYVPGVYTVQIETEQDTWTEKLIVIR